MAALYYCLLNIAVEKREQVKGKYEVDLQFTMYKVQFKSSARLRLAGDAQLIKRLGFRAQGAGGKRGLALPLARRSRQA